MRLKLTERSFKTDIILALFVVIFAVLGIVLLNKSNADNLPSLNLYVSTTGSDRCASPGVGSCVHTTMGNQNNCTDYSVPCGTVANAVHWSTSGAAIYLLSGNYSKQYTAYNGSHNLGSGWTKNVVIQPFPGDDVTMNGLNLDSAHVTAYNLYFAGSLSVNGLGSGADHDEINGGAGACTSLGDSVIMTAALIAQKNCTDGVGGLGVGSSNDVFVTNTLIHDVIDKDGIDVGDGSNLSSGITISGNVEEQLRTGPKGNHEDCLQFYGGQSNINITNNYFNGCSNSEIFMTASRGSITNANIENNTLVPCYAPVNGGTHGKAGCGWFAFYDDVQNFNCPVVNHVRQQCDTESGINIHNNDIIGAAVLHGNLIDSFSHNVFSGPWGYSNCGGSWESYNLVQIGPQKQYCPNGLSNGTGDVIATPAFVNQAANNYTLSSSPIQGLGSSCPSVSITTCKQTAGLVSGGPYTGTSNGGSNGGSQGSQTDPGGSYTAPGSNTTPGSSTTGSETSGSQTSGGGGSKTTSQGGSGGTKPVPTPAPTVPSSPSSGAGAGKMVAAQGKYSLPPSANIIAIDNQPVSSGSSSNTVNTDKLSNGIHIIQEKTGNSVKQVAISVDNPINILNFFSTAYHDKKRIASYSSLFLAGFVLIVLVSRFLSVNMYRVTMPKDVVKGSDFPSTSVVPGSDARTMTQVIPDTDSVENKNNDSNQSSPPQ